MDGKPQICGGGTLLPSLVESKHPHQLLVSLWAVTSLQPSGGDPVPMPQSRQE